MTICVLVSDFDEAMTDNDGHRLRLLSDSMALRQDSRAGADASLKTLRKISEPTRASVARALPMIQNMAPSKLGAGSRRAHRSVTSWPETAQALSELPT